MPRSEDANRHELLEKFERLKAEHRKLDQQIEELASRPFLTQEQQVRLSELKKLKLAMRDEMALLGEKLGLDF